MIHREYRQEQYDTSRRDTDIQNFIDLLMSEELTTDILTGKTTLGLIRPNIQEAVNFRSASEEEATSVLLDNISMLSVRAAFKINFDEIAFQELYQNVYVRQIEKQPENVFVMMNKWYEFQNLMTSGSSTVLLLEADDHRAVETWRSQLGHWDIENSVEKNTLRGKFGLKNYNNLLHGSDDSINALREVAIIASCLKRSW